ncbi:MAG: acetyl-CoA C-acetyltransferase, partial [Caldibacillus sp.]
MSTVIVAGARTPFGKLNGILKDFSAAQLGGMAIQAALNQARLEPSQVDHVIMGTVLQGGQGQLPSRQAARAAGIPWEVTTETINKVCASGMRSVTIADLFIKAGEAKTIVAGGMESMTNAPHAIFGLRSGVRMGDASLVDLMIYDGLTCSFDGVHMGNYGNLTAKELGISRAEQDEWALVSHRRAVAALDSGRLQEEMVPVEVPQRKGPALTIHEDEAPRRDTSLEKLSKLKPVFDVDGTITAGNAPGINDGACALVLMEEDEAKKHGMKPLAKILASETVALEAKDFPKTPGLVINKLLRKTGKKVSDIDLFEINEAFAVVTLAAARIA